MSKKWWLVAVPLVLAAQFEAPKMEPPYRPAAEESQLMAAGVAKLKGITDPDVAIYAKAAEWIQRHPEEFYKREYLANTLKVLGTGARRAASLPSRPWTKARGRLSLAYRSKVDGSLQPYGVVIPTNFDETKPMRLDVVLHGRAATMNEVSFLAAHDSEKPVPPDQDYMELEVYGRTNNAYRWAGETDVFEALADVRRRYNIDSSQILLRGFSMGGAGVWHIGLHQPCDWAGIEAGAGFNETLKYAKIAGLPEYLAPLLRIYDAYKYAANAWNVPTVGYGGEIDPQLQASRNVQAQLAEEGDLTRGARTLFLIGPQTAHKWHPESKKQSESFLRKALPETRLARRDIRFVTYTLRYNECDWVRIEGLDRHYERAEVRATRHGDQTVVRTANVSRLHLGGATAVNLDGRRFEGTDFEKVSGQWRVASADQGVRKRPRLQGPIDDAFQDPFVVVNAPGEFARIWAKYFRGDLPKANEEEALKLAATHHVVVFGEPSTNKLLARIGSMLPIEYTATAIRAGKKSYSTRDHLLKLIAPNPLAPRRYVVVNSGHTFSEADLRGTNARLYPHLPDWAVVRKSDGQVVEAGLFDERWKYSATR